MIQRSRETSVHDRTPIESPPAKTFGFSYKHDAFLRYWTCCVSVFVTPNIIPATRRRPGLD